MYCREIKTKNGQKRWICVEDAPPDPVTGERRQVSRRGKTKGEAKTRVEGAIRKLREDGIDERKVKQATFEKVAFEWLEEYHLTGVKRGTIRIREKEIKILLRYIAKVNVSNISHKKYQRILKDLSDQDYARNTISGVHTTAGMIFNYAVKERYIKQSPTIGAIVPVKRKTVEEIENDSIEENYLESSELAEFLKAVKLHGLYLDMERFYLLAFTGMRSGELCALKETDLKPNNEISITKTLYNENNNMRGYELVPPKTNASIRQFMIDEKIANMLRELTKKNKKAKMANRHLFEDFHDAGFIFSRSNGYPFAPKNILDRMNRILEKTSITKHATPHIFRHSHISMLAESGVDITEIMKRVGHDDMKTTLKIYTHVTNKMKKETSDKISFTYRDLLDESLSL